MMRGRPSTHLKHLLITGGVAAIILFILFEVTTAAGREYKDLEGPVEFTGPGFQTDPFILVLLTGLTIGVILLYSRYLRGEST